MQNCSLITDGDRRDSVIKDIISRVRGGSVGMGGGLAHNSSTIIAYHSWGRSLKYNPIVIDFEVSLFCS